MKKSSILIFLPMFMLACGGGGSNVTSIDQLPKMTGPVLTSAAASSVRIAAATTGLNFHTVTDADFDSTSSRPMCEVMNVTREVLDRAAMGDKVLCYVQNVLETEIAAGTVTSPYDGNEHVVGLVGLNEQDPAAVAKFKFKVVKTGENITEFEMFMCMDVSTQSEYLRQTMNSDGTVDISSKNSQTSGEGTWKSFLTVDGNLDSENHFTSKTISALTGWYKDATSNDAQSAELTQYSDAITFSGYQTGDWSEGVNTSTWTNRVFSTFQLLNGTSTDIQQWAMGDGSINGVIENTYNAEPPYTETGLESWLGDTTAILTPASSGDYYTRAEAGTIPTENPTTAAGAIAFEGTEVWDCSGTPEATVAVVQATLDAACDSYAVIPSGDSWINCYEKIDQ